MGGHGDGNKCERATSSMGVRGSIPEEFGCMHACLWGSAGRDTAQLLQQQAALAEAPVLQVLQGAGIHRARSCAQCYEVVWCLLCYYMLRIERFLRGVAFVQATPMVALQHVQSACCCIKAAGATQHTCAPHSI